MMRAYMTNGTFDFLKKLEDKYPAIHFYFMSGTSNDLAYYEGTSQRVFAAGREYEIIIQNGKIQDIGYVVMNNIPVTDEGIPVFEDNFKKRQQAVDNREGFLAFRLLKPMKGNTYIVFTQWKSHQNYENWKNSSDFQKAHSGTKPPAYFADRPFVNTYHMVEKE